VAKHSWQFVLNKYNELSQLKIGFKANYMNVYIIYIYMFGRKLKTSNGMRIHQVGEDL
jgi:hypothetical protein